MQFETHTFTFHGAPMRAHLSHVDACAILAAADIAPPAIPDGCNTVRAYVTLPSGEHALVVVQRGFAHIASDDEREINGVLLLVLSDTAWSELDARKILDAALAWMRA